jgi:hypothetical protein
MKTKSATLSPAIILTLLVSISALLAQQKPAPKPAPPPPPPPPKSGPGPQSNPLGSFGDALKQKAAQETISGLLDNQLPLKLDANAVHPTVPAPPGGPFAPHPLALSASDLDRPLPPGDYTIPMLAFCTEYSVHRPGAGVAYRLGPLQGKAAGAIGDLLWRGTIDKNIAPQQLQAVSWAIQSGLHYNQMPKTHQAIIDQVIPDHKNELNGDFFQSLQDSYGNLAKGTHLPPLEKMLGDMGKPGQLALSAQKQRAALLRQNTSDELKEQTLFQGQESGVYTPVKAEEGPWTEKIPGVAYLRYKIVGGNMARNNYMEIRILPQAGGGFRAGSQMPRPIYAGFFAKPAFFSSAAASPAPQTETPPSTSPHGLVGNSIGCAVGQGAQCLIPVPATASCDDPCVGHVQQVEGQVQIKRGGSLITLKAGDQINLNDQIITGVNSYALVAFKDDTQITLAEKTSIVVDSFVYDPNSHSGAVMSWAEGAFQYVSGLLVNKKELDRRIETSFGTLGIRGTEFIATYNLASKSADIDLIEGQLNMTPKENPAGTLFTAPVKITLNAKSATGAPLSQAEYNARKASLFPPAGSRVAQPLSNSGVPVL